jgi:hypothetical protein
MAIIDWDHNEVSLTHPDEMFVIRDGKTHIIRKNEYEEVPDAIPHWVDEEAADGSSQ